MSRHRNVRNLTRDDYYDDYDDYDDDYYDEDEEEEYLRQEKERREREAREARRKARGVVVVPTSGKGGGGGGGGGGGKKGKAAAAAGGGGGGGGGKQPPQQRQQQPSKASERPLQSSSSFEPALSGSEKEERVRMLSGMGFSSTAAETALESNRWDVQRSLDALLLAGGGGGGGSKGGGASGPSAPPPGFSRPQADDRGKKRQPPPSGGKAAPSGTERRSGSATIPKKSVAASSAKVGGGVRTPGKGGSGGAAPPSASASPFSPLVAVAAPSPPPRKKIPPELSKAIERSRSRLGMVVLGHVDAGKSTLMGQVLLQLGHVEKRTVTKYQKQAAELGKASFALAWVMDEDESERERGVTMDVGTKYAKTPRHDLTILDAPGHADFVPAMIAGAASADVGLLVVAATPGEFESGFDLGSDRRNGGQTREHVVLSRGLGVSQLVVAVNKLDASDPPWSRDRFEYIRGKLSPFLQSSGFNMKRVRFVPVSGLSGANVKDRKSEEEENGGDGLSSWYDGPTLLEAMDGFVPAQRNVDKPLRIIVTDVFVEGKGVTAKGRVAQGLLQTGERVAVLPVGDEATAGRIEHGTAASASSSPYSCVAPREPREAGGTKENSPERANCAMAGDMAEVTLTGIDAARVSPGCVLSRSDPALRPPVARRVRAKVLVMDELDVPIVRGAQVLLHMHSVDVPASVSRLVSSSRKDGSTRRERPRVVTGGSSAEVEIALTEKICVEEFRVCRSLGRFVLRRGGDTIAVGVIESVLG